MNIEVITRHDLECFKEELISIIKEITNKPQFGETKWLKSYQVKNMLRISTGTLQHLRFNGTLAFTKVGGIIYYKYDDIVEVLEGRKNKSPFAPHPLQK